MSDISYHQCANLNMIILTDVLNWKTSEKSYEDLCKHFKENEITKACHEELFNEYVKEALFLLEAKTNINEIISDESTYLKYHILRDVIYDKSICHLRRKQQISPNPAVYSTYEYLRWSLLMEDMSYPEFEFWYYRFYHGEKDMDYDRSKDPKPITFSDLPTDVIEKIMEKSEIKSRYILRKVSRSLRTFIDSSILKIGNIKFEIDRFECSVDVDDISNHFRWIPWCPPYVHSKKACAHLSIFTKNPKLRLDTLRIDFQHSKYRPLGELLTCLPDQFPVKTVELNSNSQKQLMDFIRRLKPKHLKKFEIDCDFSKCDFIYGIVDSEQWKQAEEVVVTNPIGCKIHHFFHFKSFDICLKMVSIRSIKKLRDGISKSSNFKWCRIRIQIGPSAEEIQRALELKIHVHNEKEYFVYTIPNSIETLVFYFFDHEIFIKKSNCFAGF